MVYNTSSLREGGMMKFILGSRSTIKLNALDAALKRAGRERDDIVLCSTQSGVNEQPVGPAETWKGALTRARAAKQAYPIDSCAVGIENGIIQFGDTWIDLAVIALITPTDRTHITTSLGLPFPYRTVEEARTRGFETTTTGSVYAEHHGCNGQDPHTTISHGGVSREQILADAIYALLCVAGLTVSDATV